MGSRDKGEGSGGLDPRDLEIGPRHTPAFGVPLHGQEFDAT